MVVFYGGGELSTDEIRVRERDFSRRVCWIYHHYLKTDSLRRVFEEGGDPLVYGIISVHFEP